MPKLGLGLLGIGLLTMMTASTAQQGCKDVQGAFTNLKYSPYRDMRKTIVVEPQKTVMMAPPDGSVPMVGRDLAGEDPPYDRNQFRVNPTAPDDSSLARGERTFARVCTPCHGATMVGDGPVAAKFMPPPDLLAQATRERRDGFLYSYIRFGGIVMPPYGAQVTAVEAWNVVNYLRHMQKTSPR